MCYTYKITGERGILPAAEFLLKRAALLLAGVLFAALTVLSGFFTADIRVAGCRYLSGENVLAFLRDNGVRENSFGRADPKEVERLLYANFPAAAFVSAEYKGMALYVRIVEAEFTAVTPETEVRDIAAAFDGIISRVLVYRGTAEVKPGDSVVKGQTIIGGYRLTPSGEKIPVRAAGEAYGTEERVFTKVFYAERQELARTGETITERYVTLFGAAFPAARSKNTFARYETEIREEYMAENSFLPFKLVTYTYYRLETATIKEDFEKAGRVYIEEAEREAEEEALKTGRVVFKETRVRDGENGERYIDVTVRVEKSFIL